jgi:hypothetical protein
LGCVDKQDVSQCNGMCNGNFQRDTGWCQQ